MTLVARRHPHGTANAYESNGCRCDACKRARYTYSTRQRAGYATGRELVPSSVVSARINELLGRGWTADQIAQASGYTRNSVYQYRAGRTPRLQRATADRFLTLTHEKMLLEVAAGRVTPTTEHATKGGLRVDAAPTMRRLRALAFAGWSPFSIARVTGLSKSELYMVRAGRRDTISAGFADRIRDDFDAMLRHPRTTSSRNRATAVSADWLPAGAWTDIEAGVLDPEAVAA